MTPQTPMTQQTSKTEQTQALYRHARQRIPGGTQLLSKRPEMFAPQQWPAYCRQARGCEVWDLDGNRYLDFAMAGIGSTLLGFADPDVTEAVCDRVRRGSQCTLNYPEEVALADRLCDMHPWAQQARFARTGGEVAAVAVRIARATTDRSKVAICGYHGWADWYLAANLGPDDSLRGHLLPGLEPLGVPRELRGSTATFRYNDREGFDRMLAEHGGQLACIVMEPCRHDPPAEGFLQHVRDEARRVGAMLIFDEITIAFRLCFGGAHLHFGVQPDMAIFAKALGNGHPIAAVIGTAEAMAGAQGSFISSTYWTEGVGPAAALATLDKMQSADAPAHVQRIGGAIRRTLQGQADRAGVPLSTHGFDSLFAVAFDHDDPLALRTLYTQEMLRRGYLAGGGVYPTLAHTDELLEPFADALAETFALLAEAIRRGDIRERLAGPVAHGGFQRLT